MSQTDVKPRRRSAARIVLCAVLFIIGLWLGWYEPLLVKLILLVPAFAVWMLPAGDRALERQSVRTMALTVGLGIGIAIALHMAAINMLGGFLRETELLWSGWFYAGFLLTLSAMYRGIARLIEKAKLPGAAAGVVRLVIILIVLPPLVAAVIQTVRAKIGYEFPPEAAAFKPIIFTTEASDGTPIRGYFFDRGKPATVVVAHGIGAHAENFLPYLTTVLDNHEVNGLIFDFRGHGYSGGHTSSFGYHETHDLLAATQWLHDEHPEAARNIILYGFSMGSAAAIYAAPHVENLSGIVIDSGLARLTDVAAALTRRMPPVIGPIIDFGGIPVASALAQAPLWTIEPIEVLDDLDVPRRVVHGSADVLIPVEQGQLLIDLPGVTGRVIANGQHTNLALADPEYFIYIGRFIDLLLAPAEPPLDAPPSLRSTEEVNREDAKDAKKSEDK